MPCKDRWKDEWKICEWAEKNTEIYMLHFDGLVQERPNFTANTLELSLPCTNPSIYHMLYSGILFRV